MIHRHYDHRNAFPAKKPRAKPRTASRIFWLLLVVGCAAVAIGRTSVSSESTTTSAGPVKMSRMSARSAQETAELNGIDGGASAGMAYITAQNKNTAYVVASTGPKPVSPTSTKLSLRGIHSASPHVTKDKALTDAVAQAKVQLEEALRTLDPPIRVMPSENQIRNDYLVVGRTTYLEGSAEDQEAWKQKGLEPNRVWAKVDVEVSESQLRQLRGKDRLLHSAKWFGGTFLTLLVGYGVIRFDTLTRGHLTIPLVLGAVASLAAAVVALFTIG